MEICCWKTNVPLVSVPTSILLVRLKDTMWPIEGKLANTGISKAVFYNGLAEIGSSPFFTSPKVRGWRHFTAGLALESQMQLLLHASGFRDMEQRPTLACWLVDELPCWSSRPWSVEGWHTGCILYVCLTWTPTVLHLVLYYTNIAKVMTTSIKFWKHGPNSHKTNFTKLCRWTENRGERNWKTAWLSGFQVITGINANVKNGTFQSGQPVALLLAKPGETFRWLERSQSWACLSFEKFTPQLQAP